MSFIFLDIIWSIVEFVLLIYNWYWSFKIQIWCLITVKPIPNKQHFFYLQFFPSHWSSEFNVCDYFLLLSKIKILLVFFRYLHLCEGHHNKTMVVCIDKYGTNASIFVVVVVFSDNKQIIISERYRLTHVCLDFKPKPKIMGTTRLPTYHWPTTPTFYLLCHFIVSVLSKRRFFSLQILVLSNKQIDYDCMFFMNKTLYVYFVTISYQKCLFVCNVCIKSHKKGILKPFQYCVLKEPSKRLQWICTNAWNRRREWHTKCIVFSNGFFSLSLSVRSVIPSNYASFSIFPTL